MRRDYTKYSKIKKKDASLASTVWFLSTITLSWVQGCSRSSGLGGLMLDTTLSCVQIETAILYILINFLRRLQKGVLHILPSLRTRFNKLFCLLVSHVPLRLQVRLVADEEDHSVGVGQVARVCQPGRKVVVSRPSCDIIDKESPCGSSVVGPRHSSEPFLASSVPDLKLNLLS